MKFFIFFILFICGVPLFSQITITMEKKNGVYFLPGEVNGIPLKFVFDTGASNVYLSSTEAIFMLKNGFIEEGDFGGISYSQVANGEIVENKEVILRELKIGSIVLRNVPALISQSLDAPLLLGQSAIEKLGPIQINGDNLTILSKKIESTPNKDNTETIFYAGRYKLDRNRFIANCDYNIKGWWESRQAYKEKYSKDFYSTYNFLINEIKKGHITHKYPENSISGISPEDLPKGSQNKFNSAAMVVNYFTYVVEQMIRTGDFIKE